MCELPTPFMRWILPVPMLALLGVGFAPQAAQGQPHTQNAHRPAFLTAKSSRDALEIGTDYLREHAASMGLAGPDLDALQVVDRHESKSTGTVHLYLRQHLGGIEVEGADLSVAVDAEGRMLALQDQLVRGLPRRAFTRATRIAAEDAILAAAAHLGLEPDGAPTALRATPGPSAVAVHAPAGISRDEIPVKLVYRVDAPGAPKLCWNVVIRTPDGKHWWNLYVDATAGEVVSQNDWIVHETYQVFPLPTLDPDEAPRALLADPADTVASPFGWHDTNGVSGAEFTDTRGNNVFAQDDTDGDDLGGGRPDGGASLDFDFPLDLNLQPGNYLDASVTNLFYLNNVVHDVMYHYGFDEAAGNFQQNNYGNGGAQGDPVQADTQDGSDTGNAQFGTPPDGFDPRMEMFRWIQSPSPRFVVTAPGAISGTYFAGPALFGSGAAGLTGTVVQALDPADAAGPTTTDACSPLANAAEIDGNIALVDRGVCTFVTKVGNAQAAGASGVIVVNNAGNTTVNMGGVDPSLTIPAISIGQSDGAILAGQLAAGVTGDMISPPARDSSLDAGVVVHEYAHGITNRLTGGASNVNCLDAVESAGMGEGWSDWFALLMTAEATDQPTDARAIAPYLAGQPASGGGIRNAPYSTDLAVSPFTYGDIGSLNQPHGVGEVWASALWEMYWNFVNDQGFDANLYTGTGGNNQSLQLVVDALKLQACDPTMVEGRDALLAAELNLSGGKQECLIWEAFAKRGLGVNASDGGGSFTLAVTEDFDVPVQCPEPGSTAMLLSGLLLLQALDRSRRRPLTSPGGPRASPSGSPAPPSLLASSARPSLRAALPRGLRGRVSATELELLRPRTRAAAQAVPKRRNLLPRAPRHTPARRAASQQRHALL